MALHPTSTTTTRKDKRMVGSHTLIGHNKKDNNANPYQPGGVMLLSYNKVVHQIARSGQDPAGLGQFCWTIYQGKNSLVLQIVAGYSPAKQRMVIY